MRAARDSTYRCHSVGRIRAARGRAPVPLATPHSHLSRRTYSGYTASVFNLRLCRGHTFRVFSVRGDAAS
jgi:hypothetical protein